MRKITREDIYKSARDVLTTKEISQNMWLDTKEVLEVCPVTRSHLTSMIESGAFPAPYRFSNKILWKQSDIETWMQKVVSGSVEEKEFTPVSEEDVLYLIEHKPCVVTNREIANELNAKYADVCSLTRIMADAGLIDRIRPKGIAQKVWYRSIEHAQH